MRQKEYLQKSNESLSKDFFPGNELPARVQALIKEIGKGKKVLDLGCGSGNVSKLIKNQNNEVYGVEINKTSAERALERGLRVKVFDIADGIPFEDSFFDVVTVGSAAESVFDSKFLFEECNRVLRPGGSFILLVRNLNSLENRLRVLKGDYLHNQGAFPEDYHGSLIRLFNLPKIEELCLHTGFKLVLYKGIAKEPTHSAKVSSRIYQRFVKFRPALADYLLIKMRRLDSF